MFENVWYNGNIKSIKVEKIVITYMDDTTETFDKNYSTNSDEQNEIDKLYNSRKAGSTILQLFMALFILAIFIGLIILVREIF